MSTRIQTFTYKTETTMYGLDCAQCGVVFAIPEELEQRWRADGKVFHCPNGHAQVFRETDVMRLQKQLDTEKRNREFLQRRYDQKRDELAAEKRSKAAVKGQLTKTKKRVANGVCPCCHRHFVNVERHMATRHPSFGGDE